LTRLLAAVESQRLKVLGADWTAEVWRVVDASNLAEQPWRGASKWDLTNNAIVDEQIASR
jgi:hypothetical protein